MKKYLLIITLCLFSLVLVVVGGYVFMGKNYLMTQAIEISSPGLIVHPGKYFLINDIVSEEAMAGSVIYIQSSDVVLDLNGWSITCNSTDPARSKMEGINVGGQQNVKILNGSVTGCFKGIDVLNSDNINISNIDFSNNTYIGLNLVGNNNSVAGSLFSNIGGYKTEAYATAINQNGRGCKISQNVVQNHYRQEVDASMVGEGVGIILGHQTIDCLVEWNTFKNAVAAERTIAIWVGRAKNTILQNNLIQNFEGGMQSGVPATARDNILINMSKTLKPIGIVLFYKNSVITGNNFYNYEKPYGKNTPKFFLEKYEKINSNYPYP